MLQQDSNNRLLEQIKAKISKAGAAGQLRSADLTVRTSRRGKYFIGPFSKEDCKYRWAGPYDTKAEARDDLKGIVRFTNEFNKGSGKSKNAKVIN